MDAVRTGALARRLTGYRSIAGFGTSRAAATTSRLGTTIFWPATRLPFLSRLAAGLYQLICFVVILWRRAMDAIDSPLFVVTRVTDVRVAESSDS